MRISVSPTRRDGRFIVSEAPGVRSRATVILEATADTVPAGTVLVQDGGAARAAVAGDDYAVTPFAGILYADAPKADAVRPVAVVDRDAEVSDADTIRPDAAADAALEAAGVRIRSTAATVGIAGL